MLSSSYLTNEDMFFKRNHGPIPILPDPTTYNLIVTGFVPDSLSLSLDFLKSLPKYTVVATLQCAENRRREMSMRRRVRGLSWGPGAIGTDITTRKGRHVEFVSCDSCKEEDGLPFRASIPMLHATTPESDVLLAYEMNGKVLSRDHGYPLRAIVPGVIGARSVKWIETIIISRFESQGFFQQKDYKMFPPDIDWHNVKWQSRRPLMDFPVNSVICEPRDGVAVKSGDMVDLYGYVVAGGGRGIERVDISIDNGDKWMEALQLPKLPIEAQAGYEDDPLRPKWAWTLWQLKFVKVETPCIVVVKAVDSAGNIQPQDVDEIWNLRGVMNNCWYKIRINAPCPPVEIRPPPEPDWAKIAAENEKRQCKSPEDHAHDKPPPDVLDKF
ncbi:hypothetical protein M758_7G087000 [Ceratodon purpureus]|nr:hypothetical protein M758_7G087000 [Ceratodon purpureus]